MLALMNAEPNLLRFPETSVAVTSPGQISGVGPDWPRAVTAGSAATQSGYSRPSARRFHASKRDTAANTSIS
jgi:hypothetical protein